MKLNDFVAYFNKKYNNLNILLFHNTLTCLFVYIIRYNIFIYSVDMNKIV